MITNVMVVSALATRWNFQPPPPNMPDAVIIMNRQKTWDWDVRNGVDPGAASFQRTLMHEALHGLGFRCRLEDPADSRISVWDIFRIGRTAIGEDGAVVAEFRDSPRMLQPGVEAYGVTALGPGNSYRLSTGPANLGGDGWEAAHWKHENLLQMENPPGSYVGIMDPNSLRVVPGLVSDSDKRAMDIIGWDIDLPDLPLPPAPPAPQNPPNNEPGASLSPQFEWTIGDGSEFTDLYVFHGAVIVEAASVISERDLLGSSFTPASNVLRPGTSYKWFATAVNFMGCAYSEEWTLTTAGCSADWDRSGTVNSSDISAFLTSWLADTSSGRLESDFNYDGMVNSTDISAHLTAWLAQVSTDCSL